MAFPVCGTGLCSGCQRLRPRPFIRTHSARHTRHHARTRHSGPWHSEYGPRLRTRRSGKQALNKGPLLLKRARG